MTYIMAVVYKIEGDEPIETQEEFIKTLPENALYFTNPLVMPEFEETQLDAIVYYYDPDTGQRQEARSILEIVQKTWVYSIQDIAERLGLSEEQVLKIVKDSR